MQSRLGRDMHQGRHGHLGMGEFILAKEAEGPWEEVLGREGRSFQQKAS